MSYKYFSISILALVIVNLAIISVFDRSAALVTNFITAIAFVCVVICSERKRKDVYGDGISILYMLKDKKSGRSLFLFYIILFVSATIFLHGVCSSISGMNLDFILTVLRLASFVSFSFSIIVAAKFILWNRQME